MTPGPFLDRLCSPQCSERGREPTKGGFALSWSALFGRIGIGPKNGARSNCGAPPKRATNFPLVRITNTSSNHVVYARTHDFSYMGAGSQGLVSAKFDVPSSIGTGASSLVVIANGIASAPLQVTISSAR
jgi:hypothetical protein